MCLYKITNKKMTKYSNLNTKFSNEDIKDIYNSLKEIDSNIKDLYDKRKAIFKKYNITPANYYIRKNFLIDNWLLED